MTDIIDTGSSLNAVLGWTSHTETATIEVSRNLTLRYQKSGSGPALILMHTIRTQLEYFRAVAPRLSENYTVYAVDLPAHGYNPIDASASFDEPYFRKAMIGFVEKLGLEDVTLVGESIGGALALTVAASIPGRVRKVIASNPYDYDTRYGDGIRRGSGFANFIIGSLQIPVFGAFFASVENKMVLGKVMAGGYKDPRKLPGDLLTQFDHAARRSGYSAASRKVLAGWKSWSAARALYANVKSPVTLVYGESDWSRADERKRTASLLPGAKVVTMKNIGHFAAVENPEGLLAAILQS